jgi:hypothetical protein
MLAGQDAVHVGLAVKLPTSPVDSVVDDGITVTEVRLEVAVVIVMMLGTLWTVTPPSVAFTNRPTVPGVVPAVKVVGEPVLELIMPMVLLVRDQENTVPAGHVPLHTGVAVKDCACPGDTDGDLGLTVTEVNVEVGAVMLTNAAALWTVFPYNVALTISPTVPEVSPAVSNTELPVVELREAMALFVRFQEYDVPGGQVERQVTFAMNV